MQIKITLRFYLILGKMAAFEKLNTTKTGVYLGKEIYSLLMGLN